MKLGLGEETCSSLYYRENAAQETTVVKVASLSTFCSQNAIQHIKLLKLDIEGAELDVLRSLESDLASIIGQVTVEFHDFKDPACVKDIKSTVRHMRELGFVYIKFSANDHSDVLFVNKRWHVLGFWMWVWLCIRYKYLRGLLRALSRVVEPVEKGKADR
jgi:hypothetical protein